jgi:hypothetical protein
MYRLRALGALGLLAVLGGTAAADSDDPIPANFDRGATGFARWNGGHPEAPKPPPPSPQVAAARMRAQESAAALRAQEQANLLRRLAACNKLRELAVQTSDESLEALADELEKRAGTVFKARTALIATGKALTPDAGQRAAADTKREVKR